MSIAGDPNVDQPVQRHWKFRWEDLATLPAKGERHVQPRGGAFRMYAEGAFKGFDIECLPLLKKSVKLRGQGRCVYCGGTHDAAGRPLKLTSEHVVPEFLGAGLELTASSCDACQTKTSSFEHALSEDLFGPARSVLDIKGKSGTLDLRHIRLDLGGLTSDPHVLPAFHHPTILILPSLYPAPAFSSAPVGIDHPYAFWMYNINADKKALDQYDIEAFSTQTVDQLRFSQLLAKIGHVYGSSYFGVGSFQPALTQLIRGDYPIADPNPPREFYSHIGCLWQCRDYDGKSECLHEIQPGSINFNGKLTKAVRIRLFSCFDMPSYFVALE
ncbi:hypothetical protein [Methylobacterium sp. V23]|uniref:hypothetical protein n=1 Tax=Methylobacterium sp. V23 TaxID=2044878 RepID=UPI0011B00BC3|nr:hypothetical protein [Methylobacterium sp. V23]